MKPIPPSSGHESAGCYPRRPRMMVFCLMMLVGAFSGCGILRSFFPERESLQAQIGQMIMVGFRGTSLALSDPLVADIRDGRIGGVILFDYDVPRRAFGRNICSPEQTRWLIADLQACSSLPLLIAVDHEGGKVTRLKERDGFPATVSAQSLGTADDVGATGSRAGDMADTLSSLGFNINFAPVVDLNVNPRSPAIGALERSFSADPALVTRHALAFIEAHHARGVACTLKHFPGHGSVASDPHHGIADVTGTWSEAELEPFQTLIDAGAVDAVMVGHLYNARLDRKYPATLSSAVIDVLLRKRLGFQGVVISDDMQMGAIRGSWTDEIAVERAVNAGVDILLFANNSSYEPGVARRILSLITSLVDQGRISRARIETSYGRILTLKSRLRSFPPAR